MTTPALAVRDVWKHFRALKKQRSLLRVLRAGLKGASLREDFWALRDISFSVEPGEFVALVGDNGSGKTTLLRVIAGIFAHSSGTVEATTRPEVVFSLDAGSLEQLPVIENLRVFHAIYGIEDVDGRLAEEALDIAGLGDHRFALLRELSRGQRQRLVLSVVFQRAAEILLVDESFSFLDGGFQKVAEGHLQNMRRTGKTMMMASHDDALLRRHCQRGLWLDQGALRMDGRLDDVLAAYRSDAASTGGESPVGRSRELL